jgi:hypothetical protein
MGAVLDVIDILVALSAAIRNLHVTVPAGNRWRS